MARLHCIRDASLPSSIVKFNIGTEEIQKLSGPLSSRIHAYLMELGMCAK